MRSTACLLLLLALCASAKARPCPGRLMGHQGNIEHPTMLRRALLQLDDILGYVKQAVSGSGQQQGGTSYRQQPRQEQQGGGSWQPSGQQDYWQGYQQSSGAGSTVVVQQGGGQQQAQGQAWSAASWPSSTSGSPSTYQTYYPSNPSSGSSNGGDWSNGGGWSNNPQGSGTSQPQQQAPSGSSSGTSSAPNSDMQAVLDRHNMYRAKHQAGPLSWDANLAAGSQAWSDNCVFQHSNPNGQYGENLAMGHNSFVDAVDDWYNEVSQYSYGNGGFSEATGHFTQVIWRGSTTLGCGWSSSCKMYTCRYAPAGNVMGQFEQNVLPPTS